VLSCVFLTYLAFLRPAADRADCIFTWIVSRGHSHGFLWADSIIQTYEEADLYSLVVQTARSSGLIKRKEELQQHHNYDRFLFLTILLLSFTMLVITNLT
jgi:hypothetical protein